MKKHPRCVFLMLAALSTSAALAQNRDFSAIEINAHHVAGNVYYLEGENAGGNVGVLVGEDGVLMIDDQFAPLSEKIVAAIRTISDGPIRFVVNTHIHGDHVGGNENFGNMGATIVAHDNVRVRLAQASQPAAALPILTYADSVSMYVDGEEVRIVKVPPAHTDGDSYIHFTGSNVLHLGDVFRTTGYPRVDSNNGGTVKGTLEALAVAIDMAGPDTRVIPGHGVISTRADVIEFRDMIAEVERRVSALIEQGMTIEQVLAAEPLADLDARWGDSATFLPGFYDALKKDAM